MIRHSRSPKGIWLIVKVVSRSGHTVIEVALGLIVITIVLASVSVVLISQHRFYALNAQLASTRDAARIAVEVLTGELRAASPAAGDLYAIARDSVALRSSTGIGVICGVSGSTIELWRWMGSFADSGNDSALVFVENDPATSLDDAWVAASVRNVRSGGGSACPGGRPSSDRLVLDREVTGAVVGSLVRAFRPYVYKLYAGGDGRWWLGQRLRYGRIQPITGPFAHPTEGGLRLEFIDRGGDRTLDPTRVVEVRVSIKAQSARRVPGFDGAYFLTDSLSAAVYLRNS